MRSLNLFSTFELSLRRNLLSLFIAGLLFWSSMAALLPTLSLYVKHVGASNHQVGIVMGAFAVGLVLFRPWMGRLADCRGRKLVLIIGLAVVAIAHSVTYSPNQFRFWSRFGHFTG